MEKEVKKTDIGNLGEFGLIERIKDSTVTRNPGTKKGIGDDAAVIDTGSNLMVVSSDILVEEIHFDLSFMPLKHLGYKSAVVNISDIAAMNAIPRQLTVNLALSNRFSVEAIDEFYKGISSACENYKVDLVGGDTSSSTSGLIISITAMGEVTQEEVTYRSGAKENDIICVTGDLGASYLGLQVLKREKAVYLANPDMQPELSDFDYLVKRHLKPEARTDIIHELKEAGIKPTAMIDISDGLASELLHIAKESGHGLNIHSDKLPIDDLSFKTAEELNLDPTTCALNGGEDYELLFTVDQNDYEKIKYLPDITLIGYITAKGGDARLVTNTGDAIPLKAQGWQHF
ncbi:thiamine-phosphate kinase [Fulvivirgaceae bacterium BMA12]|uniref:Thiamine-monophosphate kinase n=1 Tax=Agaribacillus aureus TaxID=3051825 RepID=A0ABT8L993_9BACT|nr:thiamine-phosphate kinase [Fulvivirgaceae bacterium BMA12]